MIRVIKITQGNTAIVLEGRFAVQRGDIPAISGHAIGYRGLTSTIQGITSATIEADTGTILHEAWQAGSLEDNGRELEVRFEGMRITSA